MAFSPTLPAANPFTLERRATLRPANLLRLWHLTSLDAPTVAVTWCLAFAHAVQVRLPLWLPVVLGLSAWAFYIGDRLLDTRKALHLPLTPSLQPRHRYHWKHRRFFLPLAIAASLFGLGIVLHFMPTAARPRNTLLTASALAYFGSVHAPSRFPLPRLRRALRLPKELLVGLIFTASCALPAWSRMLAGRLTILPVFLVFAALAWLNCQAIDTWECAPAKLTVRIQPLSVVLAAASLLLAAGFVFFHQPRLTILLATAVGSSLGIAFLHRHQRHMEAVTLRAAADLVLLTPLAMLFLP